QPESQRAQARANAPMSRSPAATGMGAAPKWAADHTAIAEHTAAALAAARRTARLGERNWGNQRRPFTRCLARAGKPPGGVPSFETWRTSASSLKRLPRQLLYRISWLAWNRLPAAASLSNGAGSKRLPSLRCQ